MIVTTTMFAPRAQPGLWQNYKQQSLVERSWRRATVDARFTIRKAGVTHSSAYALSGASDTTFHGVAIFFTLAERCFEAF